jgi:hypothetical protein
MRFGQRVEGAPDNRTGTEIFLHRRSSLLFPSLAVAWLLASHTASPPQLRLGENGEETQTEAHGR